MWGQYRAYAGIYWKTDKQQNIALLALSKVKRFSWVTQLFIVRPQKKKQSSPGGLFDSKYTNTGGLSNSPLGMHWLSYLCYQLVIMVIISSKYTKTGGLSARWQGLNNPAAPPGP